LKVKAVVVRSRGGKSAAMVAATRPAAPILALTTDPVVCRRLNLLWGVVPMVITPLEFDHPRAVARRLVQELGLAQPGQCILLVAGFGENEPTITVLPV
jgi:pyruvate kinase